MDNEKIKLPRAAKGPRPMMFENEANDILLSMNVSLLNELIVTRQRLDTVERILTEKDIIQTKDIDNFCPEKDALKDRENLRAEITDRVFYLLLQQAERFEAKESKT